MPQNTEVKRWGEVIPNLLYRSGQISSDQIEEILRTHDIQTIVNLTYDVPELEEQQAEAAAVEKLNIEMLRFPLRGWGTGKVAHYVGAVVAIHNAVLSNKKTLVHCSAGTQRTGGVLTVYKLLVKSEDPATVYEEMKFYGWNPDDEGDKFLIGFLNDMMEVFAAELLEQGVINAIPNPMPQLPL